MPTRVLIDRSLGNLSKCWHSLVRTDLIYKLLAFCLFSPVFSLVLGYALALSGNRVLTDLDIVHFIAGPLGLFLSVLLGAIWLGLLAIEQASLLGVLAAESQGKKLGPIPALLFAIAHSPRILQLTGRLIIKTAAIAAPFLLMAGAVYFLVLGDHDINFYLHTWPLEFRIAVAFGIALALGLIGLLLRFLSSWFLALPLILFERMSAKEALRVSSQKTLGNRFRVFGRLVLWLLLVLTAHFLVTWGIGRIAAWLVPNSIGSLAVLAGRVGSMLVILAITSIALNVLASISFAILLFGCFREFCPEWSQSLVATNLDSYSKPTARYLLTKSRMIFGGFIGLLAVALIGFWAVESLELTDHTQVMAHRGSSKAAPENSLAAIQQAIEDRSDWVEIDVQETLDGQVVVVHDSDLMKLAKSPRKIWETNSQELGSIDIGSLFDPKFSKERVPKLEEVLNLCRDRIGVIIELKYYGHDQRLEQRVVELVERTGMARQVMIMSLKPEGIRKLRALRPAWKCGLLLSVAVGDLKTVDADFLAINAKFASRSLVRRIHSAGKQVFVWTVDEPATMSSLMNRGVDGILTNRPEIARGVIENRARMSLTERLLTELAAMLRSDKKQIPEEP